MHKNKKILFFIFSIFLTGLAFFYLNISKYKLLWLDEGFELANTCSINYLKLISYGAAQQCSASPLYYLFQKFFVTSMIHKINLLQAFRLLSIVAALLCLVSLFWFVKRQFGVLFGFFSLALLIQFKIFHHYVIENRPYMLWMLLFTITIFATLELTQKNILKIKLTHKFLYLICCLALTMVANPGVVQVIFLLASLGFIWILNFKVKPSSIIFFFSPILISSLAIGMYYALIKCAQSGSAGEWDLLETQNWNLLKDVVSLLFPLHLQLGSILLNILFIFGVYYPFSHFYKYHKLSITEKSFFSMSVISIFQIICTMLIGVLVAYKHYFFIQRVFIFLIIIRTLLITCGACFLIQRYNKEKYLKALSVITFILLLSSLGSLGMELYNKKMVMPKIANFNCEGLTLPISFVADAQPTIDFYYNFSSLFINNTKECKDLIQGPHTYVLGLQTTSKIFNYKVFKSSKPENLKVVSACGIPLEIYNTSK